MSALLGIAVYVTGVTVTYVVAQRLRPYWFFDERKAVPEGARPLTEEEEHDRRRRLNSYFLRWEDPRVVRVGWTQKEPEPLVLLGLVLWPILLLSAVLASLGDANLRAMNQKTKLRAELEAELAKAKQEIEDLLSR